MVSKLLVYSVVAVVNSVVSLAVRATKFTVVSLNVYSPSLARVSPEPAVPPVDAVMELTVFVTDGMKNVNDTVFAT